MHEGRSPSPEPAGASQLGRYQLVRLIQSGGMARVYEGRRASLANVSVKVAVKVIRPEHASDDTFRTLFINEARIGAQLHHQNLVQIQDFDQEGEQFYLVMEYVEGFTVRKLISLARRAGRAVPRAFIAEIGRQACEGLYYFHNARSEQGTPLRLVHRDVKPSNLIVNPQGVIKILDFGISKALIASERKGSVKGTWGFMSPEQASGSEIDGAADQYALAALLYELVALRPLFPDRSPEKVRDDMVVDAPAARAAQLGGDWAGLSRVLVRALQRDPAARYPDARAMGEALFRLVDDPVRVSERMLTFVDLLAKGTPPAPPPHQHESPRSQDTMSRIQEQGPYSGGVPVGVGDRRRPQPPPPPVSSRPKSALTRSRPFGPGYAALTAFGVCVVAFTIWRLFIEPGGMREESLLEAPDAVVAATLEGGEAASDETPPPEASEAELTAADAVGTADDSATLAPPAVAAVAPISDAAPADMSAYVAPQDSAVGAAVGADGGAISGTVDDDRAAAIAAAIAGVGQPDEAAEGAAAEGASVEEEPQTIVVVRVTEKEPESSGPALGAVTISSVPRAKVLVDGKYVRYTPLFKHELPVGAHSVELATDDGRSKRFRVDVAAEGEVRRVWLFDEGRWAD